MSKKHKHGDRVYCAVCGKRGKEGLVFKGRHFCGETHRRTYIMRWAAYQHAMKRIALYLQALDGVVANMIERGLRDALGIDA